MKSKRSIVVQACIILILSGWFESAMSQSVTIISGRVTDADGSPLEGVKIEVEKADLSTTSKKDGSYKIIVTDLAEAQIKFSLKDYDPVTKIAKLTEKQIQLDMRLSSARVQIKMTDFRSQAYIRGEVKGLSPKEYSRYKMVTYILTDQWYIHPYADNAPGRGFANLDSTGKWELQTVWRGYQAHKVAFLLLQKEAFAPPTVPLDYGPPETSLLNEAKCGDRYLIIEAPKGI